MSLRAEALVYYNCQLSFNGRCFDSDSAVEQSAHGVAARDAHVQGESWKPLEGSAVFHAQTSRTVQNSVIEIKMR